MCASIRIGVIKSDAKCTSVYLRENRIANVKLSVRYIVHGIRLLEMNSGRARTRYYNHYHIIHSGYIARPERVGSTREPQSAFSSTAHDRVIGFKYITAI